MTWKKWCYVPLVLVLLLEILKGLIVNMVEVKLLPPEALSLTKVTLATVAMSKFYWVPWTSVYTYQMIMR